MDPLRILFHVDRLATGGMQNTSLNLARALHHRGHRVLYAADRGPMESVLEKYGLEYRRVPYEGLRRPSLATMRALGGILDELRPHVLHTFSNWCGLEGLLAGTVERGVPVYTHHLATDLPAFRYPPSARVAAICPWFRDRFLERGYSPSMVDVISRRIDLERHQPAEPDPVLAHRLGVDLDRRRIVTISRLHPGKMGSLGHVFEAVDLLRSGGGPDSQLVVVGDGPSRHAVEELASRLNERHGPGSAVLTGEILDTAAVFALADVAAVMASTAMRALACGVPTAIVGRNGFSELVTDTTVGPIAYHNFCGTEVTSPQTPHRLAEALGHLLDDEGARRALGDWSLGYARRALDARRGAEQLEMIYRELAARPPSRAKRLRMGREVAAAIGQIYLSKLRGRLVFRRRRAA